MTKMTTKPLHCCFIISSVLGIYFGITIFFVFTFYYNNCHAGLWGLISAIFASACLHLKLLYSNNRLQNWYSAKYLSSLAAIAFISVLISFGFTAWYIIYASYHKIPMLPVQTSFYLAAVWSFMATKWSFAMFLLAYKYSRYVAYNTPFLIINENV